MSNQIRSISLVKDKSLSNDVFPQKNGDRFHTTFANDVIQGIFEKDDKCILTLLKDKTYSLSIKLQSKDKKVLSFKNRFNDILVFDNNKKCFAIQDTYDNFQVSYILIIGGVDNTGATTFQFNITKTFLIIDTEVDNIDSNTLYKDVTIEEYLNLYYIEHFSLNIIEFSELYKKYKTNTGEGVGEQEEAVGEERVGEGVEEVGTGGEEGVALGGEEVALGGEEGVAPGGEDGRQGGGGGTEMTGKKKTVKKIKKNKNKVV
jgi:hypothetical protein